MLHRICLMGVLLISIRCFPLQQFSLEGLQSPSPSTLVTLQKAVSEVGIFAVSGHTTMKEHSIALRELTRCVHSGVASSYTSEAVLQDMTLRTTIATATNHSEQHAFDDELAVKCPQFIEAAAHLRAAAAATGEAYAKILDLLAAHPSRRSTITSATPLKASIPVDGTTQVDSELVAVPPMAPLHKFGSIVADAESLEHFHVFRRLAGNHKSNLPTLHLHSDMGLFVVMTPPQYFRLATGEPVTAEHGFVMQLRSGQVVYPEFPEDALLVMNGEGNAHWVRSPASDHLFAPPHEVSIPNLEGLGRAWYGRMYLPPRDAVIRGGNLSFNQYWTQSRNAVIKSDGRGVPALGCSPTRRFLLDEGTCSSGEMYCWMTCMSVKRLTCPTSQMVCADPEGKAWPADYLNDRGEPVHCYSCEVRCNAAQNVSTAAAHQNASAPTGFCNTNCTLVLLIALLTWLL